MPSFFAPKKNGGLALENNRNSEFKFTDPLGIFNSPTQLSLSLSSGPTAMDAAASISITDEDVIKDEPLKLLSPNNPIPEETVFLSNIDLAVAFTVETVYFFEVDGQNEICSAVEISRNLKKAVVELLIPYYFMAGRLNVNQKTGRLELVCNNGGALFVNAKSKVTLKEIGDLSLPNPTFHHFVHRPGIYKSLDERPLFTIQVTELSCGSFAIGMVTNHGVLDGKSATDMFQTLASLCRSSKQHHRQTLKPCGGGGGGGDLIISNDRSCFKARNPPKITFDHHKEYTILNLNQMSAPPLSAFTALNKPLPSPPSLSFSISTHKNLIHRLIPFTPHMISNLKSKANKIINNCSTFEAILAHLWKARTIAVFKHELTTMTYNHDELSTVLFAVDIRSKVCPSLPDGFAGNAVITAYASAKVSDMIEKPFSFCVEKVKEGIERVTDEYVRSAIDWLEVYKGIPATCNGKSFYVSAWWKLPFNEIDFGFGKLVHGGPVANGNDEFVLLLSQPKGTRENYIGTTVNVWIALEKEKMEDFMIHIFRI